MAILGASLIVEVYIKSHCLSLYLPPYYAIWKILNVPEMSKNLLTRRSNMKNLSGLQAYSEPPLNGGNHEEILMQDD
jgi:hypothetical protein